nr:hypothetical protein [Tanacetum cinerariifolium]
MINGYAQIGEVDNALLECLRKLRGDGVAVCHALVDMYVKCKCFSGVAVCNALVDMYGKCKCFSGVANSIIGVHQQSSDHDDSFGPDLVTVTTMLPACSNLAVLRHGKEIHGYTITKGLGNHNSEDRADDTYLHQQCCNGHGFKNEELDVFRKMCETDVTPDEVTFVGVLSACDRSRPAEELIYNELRSWLHSLFFVGGFCESLWSLSSYFRAAPDFISCFRVSTLLPVLPKSMYTHCYTLRFHIASNLSCRRD